MIVPTMNYGEIFNELNRDLRSVKVKGEVMCRLIKQLMQRKKLRQYTCLLSYRTASYNTWHICLKITPFGNSKAYFISTRDKVSSVTYQLMFNGQNQMIYMVKMCKHFFDRYNERLSLGLAKHQQVVKHYITHNLDNEMGHTEPLPNGKRLMEFVYHSGIGIGWEDEEKKVICLKTFIANNMLNKNQKRLADYIKSHDDSMEFFTYVNPKHYKKSNPD